MHDLFGATTSREVFSTETHVVTPRYREEIYGPKNYNLTFGYNVHSIDLLNPGDGLKGTYMVSDFNALRIKLLLKIKDQNVNLAMAVKELGTTTDMVADLVRDVVKSFRKLRGGQNIASFARKVKNPQTPADKRLANRYLEWTYGWSPTMQDIYGLSVQLQQRIIANQWIYCIVRSSDESTQIVPFGSGQAVNADRLFRKITARYKVDNTKFKTLSQLGITNPALVAYESIPYSFVLDWIIGIGDFLSTFDALVGVKDLQFVESAKFVRSSTQSNLYSAPGSIAGVGFIREIRTRRSGVKTNLSVLPPSFEPMVNLRRGMNAIALLRQVFK